MQHYTLFLDESMVDNRFFSVAGIMASKTQRKAIKRDVNALKETLWQPDNYPVHYRQRHPVTYYPKACTHDFVLHELAANQIKSASNKNIAARLAKYGHQAIIFKEKRVLDQLYAGAAKILDANHIAVTGVVFDLKHITDLYGVRPPIDGSYEMAIQIIVENFVQFLLKHNAHGDIVVESRSAKSDLLVQSKFYYIKAHGTLFIPDALIQRHIGKIEFIPKHHNSPCLQLADLVPNNFARKMANKPTNNLGRTLLNRRYDGGCGQPERFGIRQIPSS